MVNVVAYDVELGTDKPGSEIKHQCNCPRVAEGMPQVDPHDLAVSSLIQATVRAVCGIKSFLQSLAREQPPGTHLQLTNSSQ